MRKILRKIQHLKRSTFFFEGSRAFPAEENASLRRLKLQINKLATPPSTSVAKGKVDKGRDEVEPGPSPSELNEPSPNFQMKKSCFWTPLLGRCELYVTSLKLRFAGFWRSTWSSDKGENKKFVSLLMFRDSHLKKVHVESTSAYGEKGHLNLL